MPYKRGGFRCKSFLTLFIAVGKTEFFLRRGDNSRKAAERHYMGRQLSLEHDVAHPPHWQHFLNSWGNKKPRSAGYVPLSTENNGGRVFSNQDVILQHFLIFHQ